MTLGVGGLGAYSLITEPALRRERVRLKDFVTGLGSAAGLYAIFQVGDRLARRMMPAGDREIAGIYELRGAAPRAAIATALGLVIGPGEELFWRGLVQRRLMRRFGRLRGTLLFWGAVYAREDRVAPLIISHVAWDIWIFLIAPTVKVMPSSRRN